MATDFLGCDCRKGELRHRSDCEDCTRVDQEYIDAMAKAYLVAALWTADEEIISPTSGKFDPSPYLGRCRKSMREEARRVCSDFYTANRADLADYPPDAAGHDLWLTRNGHGAGFWEADHCDEATGERLTAAADKLGERHVYKHRGWFGME